MNFLPKASGTRPRVACEIAPEGVVAARSESAASPLANVGCVSLRAGAVAPGLKPGNLPDRLAVVAALRKAMEDVGARANARNADITLVIPDGACRVLLLDFDALPNKLSEALPLVRFRLKKLVPFDADEAMVSFQVMSQSKQMVRVLAVAIPRDVLAEYETLAREAGFEPGAVLPSTLAAVAAVDDAGASLIVNASRLGVTTAIVREGILLLHRTVDLQLEPAGVPANMPAALFEPGATDGVAEFERAPVVSREDTAAEWAAQDAVVPGVSRSPYAVAEGAEEAVQNEDGITGLRVPDIYAVSAAEGEEPAPVTRSPYAGPTVTADLNAELHNAILYAPMSPGTLTDPASAVDGPAAVEAPQTHRGEPLPQTDFAQDVAQAVSVAAAYYEDTLAAPPSAVLAAGAIGAKALEPMLDSEDGLRVRDLVASEAIAADAVSARVPRSILAGVLGALRG